MKKKDFFQKRLDAARSIMIAVIFILLAIAALLHFINFDMNSSNLLPFYSVFGIYALILVIRYIEVQKQVQSLGTSAEEIMSDENIKIFNRQDRKYIYFQLIFHVAVFLFILIAPQVSHTFESLKTRPLAYLTVLVSASVWVRQYLNLRKS